MRVGRLSRKGEGCGERWSKPTAEGRGTGEEVGGGGQYWRRHVFDREIPVCVFSPIVRRRRRSFHPFPPRLSILTIPIHTKLASDTLHQVLTVWSSSSPIPNSPAAHLPRASSPLTAHLTRYGKAQPSHRWPSLSDSLSCSVNSHFLGLFTVRCLCVCVCGLWFLVSVCVCVCVCVELAPREIACEAKEKKAHVGGLVRCATCPACRITSSLVPHRSSVAVGAPTRRERGAEEGEEEE